MEPRKLAFAIGVAALVVLGLNLPAHAEENFRARVTYDPPLTSDPYWGERFDAGNVSSATQLTNCYTASTGAVTGAGGSVISSLGDTSGPGVAGDAGDYSPVGWRASGIIFIYRFLDGGTETTAGGSAAACTFQPSLSTRVGAGPGNATTNGWANTFAFTGGGVMATTTTSLSGANTGVSRAYHIIRASDDLPVTQWCLGDPTNAVSGGCNADGIDRWQMGYYRQFTEIDPVPQSPVKR